MSQIKALLNTVNKYAIISALAALGMGVILILASDRVFQLVCVIFGLLILVPALFWIYEGVIKGGGAKLIVPGVLAALAGAFVTFRSADLAALIGIFFGVFLLIAGLVHVCRALLRKQSGDSGWLLSCVLGAGVCVFGVICIVRNGAVTITLMRIYGVSFLIYAAAALISAFEFNKIAAALDGVETTGTEVYDEAEDYPEAEPYPEAYPEEEAYSEEKEYTDAELYPEAEPYPDETVEIDGRVIEVIGDDAEGEPEA